MRCLTNNLDDVLVSFVDVEISFTQLNYSSYVSNKKYDNKIIDTCIMWMIRLKQHTLVYPWGGNV